MAVELVDLIEVERMTLMSRSTIYRRIADGSFPKPIELGPKKRVFVRAEVDAYINARLAARDREAA